MIFLSKNIGCKNNKCLVSVLLTLLMSPTLPTLGSDAEQVLQISANRSEYNDAEQRQSLFGDVVIEQGNLLIKADEITVYLKEGEPIRLEAQGSPIRYQQKNAQGEVLSGQSQQIVYDIDTGQLSLRGDAQLESPRQKLQSDTIDYNINTRSTIASGGDQRVNILIKPEKQASQ